MPCGGRETGARKACLCFFTHVSCPRRSLSGGFGGYRMDQPLFSLPLAFPKRKRLPARQLVQGDTVEIGKGAENG